MINRNANGEHEQVQGRAEEEIISPARLAAIISQEVAAEVSRQLKNEALQFYRHTARTVAGRTSTVAIECLKPTLAIMQTQQNALGALGREIHTTAEQWNESIRSLGAWLGKVQEAFENRLTEGMDEIHKVTQECLQKVRDSTAQMLPVAQAASVQTLTGLIGKELEQYELETLIRNEVHAAVRAALRETLTKKDT